MTTRLYFLVDGDPAARRIVDDLRAAGIGDDIYGVAHRERYPLEGVPEADLTDRTDLLPAARLGVSAGAAGGLLAGLAAVALAGPGVVVAGGAVVASLTAAGASVGTLGATLVGIGVTHRDLQPFEQALDQGKIVLLVDVPDGRESEIEQLIRRHDADIVIAAGELDEAEKPAV